MAAFADYSADPNCRPGQKQFVDLSAVTEILRDYTKIMEMQAIKTDVFMGGDAQPIIIYYAPTQISQNLAGIILRSWESFSAVVPVVVETEKDAMEILGLKEISISQMLTAAA